MSQEAPPLCWATTVYQHRVSLDFTKEQKVRRSQWIDERRQVRFTFVLKVPKVPSETHSCLSATFDDDQDHPR